MKRKILIWLALVLGGSRIAGLAAAEGPAATANAATEPGTYICAIQMIDAQDGWASTGLVAGHSLLLRTTDGGVGWRDCTPSVFSAGGEVDGALSFLDSQDAWVTTYDSKQGVAGLLRTTNGGGSWAWFKTAALLRDAHFFDANHGVASEVNVGMGSAEYRFFQTHDGGANWEPILIFPPDFHIDSDEPLSTLHLCNMCGEMVAYHPPGKFIITRGDMGDEQPKGAVRLSIAANYGGTWRDLKLPLPSEKYREGLAVCGSPVFVDETNGWIPAHIARENDDHSFSFDVLAFYFTQDGGETWTGRPGIIEDAGGYMERRQVAIVSARDIFVGGGGKLYATHDGARSWQAIKPNLDFGGGASKHEVSQLDFVDAAHGWVIMYDNENDALDGHAILYKTSDGGATWMELPLKMAH